MVEVIVISQNEDSKYKDKSRIKYKTPLYPQPFSRLSHFILLFLSLGVILSSSSTIKEYNLYHVYVL